MSERFKTKVAAEAGEGGKLVFVKPADLSRSNFTGVIAEGQFVSSMPNSYDESKTDFKIVADVAFKFSGVDKDGDRYDIDVEAGDTLVINGAGNLGYFMKQVPVGELCQIKYNGKKEMTSGPRKGTLAHNFDVMTE